MAKQQQPIKVQLKINFFQAKYIVLFAAVATGVAGAIIAIYTYQKFIPQNKLSLPVIEGREEITSEEIKNLTAKISEIAALPQETPQVHIISDLTQLKANPFFKDARVKDFILIYAQAQKIIVYDPSTHRIINMGPYSPSSDEEATPQATPSNTGSPEPDPVPTSSPVPSEAQQDIEITP